MILWAQQAESPDLYAALTGFVTNRLYGKTVAIHDGTIAGVFRGSQMVAGMLFHNWDKDAGVVELTGAGEGHWLTRSDLCDLWGYAEKVLGVQAVLMRISPKNYRARAVAKKMGGVEYAIPRMGGRKEAKMICIITVDAWRATGIPRALS